MWKSLLCQPRQVITRCTLFHNTNLKFHTTAKLRNAPDFYKLLTTTTSQNTKTSNGGLFGYKILQKPQGWYHFAKQQHEACQQLVKQIDEIEIPKGSVEAGRKVIKWFDDISNNLCLILDSAELCSSVHQDYEFRKCARDASNQFSEYMHYLNTNASLHKKLLQVVNDKELFSQLSDLDKRIAVLLAKDMEKQGGVQLENNAKEDIIQLNSRIHLLEQEFAQLLSEEELDQTPMEISHEYKLRYPELEQMVDGNNILYPHYYGYVLNRSPIPELRKECYMRKNRYSSKTLDALQKLITHRHKLAQLLGHKSYAHLFVNDLLAESPEKIRDFLIKLARSIEPKALKELDLIKRWKIQEENDTSVYEWDIPYYQFKIRQLMNLQGNITKYFPLHECLSGLYTICKRVFGIELKPVPCDEGEVWHPDVIKLEVLDENGVVLGDIYLDLFQRPNKISNDCHFTIRTGKKISDTEYQKPAGAFVCSFSRNSNGITYLTHSEVTTLFHEFGHALHTILGTTDYQSTSGTRTSLDFVETPSQFMENFCWDYRVVSQFAKDPHTGKVLPEEEFEKHKASARQFACLTLQRTILLSLFDITIFGEPTNQSTVEIFKQLKNKYCSIPFVEGTSGELMIHLANYGAGYYTYLYSKVFSSQIWYKFFNENPWSREAGERYKQKVLSHGGGKDPKLILEDMLEEEPNPIYLLNELGCN